tara:strand:- start:1139 stop:1294 length:156 start_codon:yes stop_codon:yes gene_type:complete
MEYAPSPKTTEMALAARLERLRHKRNWSLKQISQHKTLLFCQDLCAVRNTL